MFLCVLGVKKQFWYFLRKMPNQRFSAIVTRDLRKGEEADEIFRFIEFWKKQTGKKPPHLVFDSKLTSYKNLSKINEDEHHFCYIETQNSERSERSRQCISFGMEKNRIEERSKEIQNTEGN